MKHATCTARSRKRAGGAGFTLLEMVVAVGVVALVTVGLAAIFDAVGKTVSGGKRASRAASLRSVLEEQFRRDINAITRDGFLVIRHQYVDGAQEPPDNLVRFTGNGDKVALSTSDPKPRPRRTDELLFFTREACRSARPPMVPGAPVEGDAARIYYGHGQRRRGDDFPGISTADADLYNYPTIADSMESEGQYGLGRQGSPAYNRYASEWTLLRQVLVLAPPRTTAQRDPEFFYGLNPSAASVRDLLADKEGQVAYQPAVPSVFRAFNYIYPTTPSDATKYLRPTPSGVTAVPATLASGLVDVATTDLAEIRAIVTSFPIIPGSPTQPAPGKIAPTSGVGTLSMPSLRAAFEPLNPSAPPSATRPNPPTVLDFQQGFMANALPAESDPAQPGDAAYRPDIMDINAHDAPGVRARYEPVGPTLRGTWTGANDAVPPGASPQLAQAWERGDRHMLAASNFVPRCSEFIVEWSFGQTDDNNETIWFGSQRWNDANANGIVDPGEEEYASPYPRPNAQNQPRWLQSQYHYRDVDRSTTPPTYGDTVKTGTIRCTPRLLYGYQVRSFGAGGGSRLDDAVLTTYFGYTDPRFNPKDPTSDGAREAIEPVLPWPWPKLIRITLSVADERDPNREETFQFVFRLPEWSSGS